MTSLLLQSMLTRFFILLSLDASLIDSVVLGHQYNVIVSAQPGHESDNDDDDGNIQAQLNSHWGLRT